MLFPLPNITSRLRQLIIFENHFSKNRLKLADLSSCSLALLLLNALKCPYACFDRVDT